MQYYAHKSDSGNELLIDHLKLTAELAADNGLSFNHESVCRQLGLLHDIGKHTEKFQDVLFKNECKQDHAIVAAVLYNKFSDKYNINAWLRHQMSLIMACHHSYLYSDCYNFSKKYFEEKNFMTFEYYTKDDNKAFPVKNENEYTSIQKYMSDNDLLIDITDNDFFDIEAMSENEKMFYVRMLYSCLVDADYSATSIFCNNKSKSDFMLNKIDADACLNKLDLYHNNLVANSDSKSIINDIRTQVYNSCCNKGSVLTGFVTLTAPTGSGKTLALMKFALEQAKRFNKDRIFVVLPYLSIIDQNSEIYKDIFGSDIVLVDDSQTELTGDAIIEAERWSASIIVTTSVNFFETLFASKASNVRKLHNIANSVIVFDECQTFPSKLLNSTIEILQSLTKYYNSTVLFSTATRPLYTYRDHDEVRDRSGKMITVSSMKWQSNEIIDDVQSLFDKYDSIKNTNVEYSLTDSYTCSDLIDYFKDESQVMYVFNTVGHAVTMYENLIARYDDSECYIITSNLCAADKLFLINEINNKLKQGRPVKLAATQCIEAGVDFDFKAGARECAPFESIIQTAGRVNRNCKNNGRFLIFMYEKHGRYDYPSVDYKNASEITKFIAQKKNGLLFYDLTSMDLYYKRLYRSEDYKSDSIELYNAEYDNNYKMLSDNYKMIENKNQVIIIVEPLCGNDRAEFESLIQDVVNHDYTISKKLMRKLAKYTVSSYISSKFDFNNISVQLRLRSHPSVNLDWFLLRDASAYSATGLLLKKDVDCS